MNGNGSVQTERAIISVSDKTDVVEFAKRLVSFGFEVVASSGTYKILKDSGLLVKEIAEITNFNEMLGGRVKTLHPAVHAGILATESENDRKDLKAQNIELVSVVVCNLYPFKKVINELDCTLEKAIENIDIGGVALLRAAAKNFSRVCVVCDPRDYNRVCSELEERKSRRVSEDFRRELALKAFEHTASYDESIAAYMRSNLIKNRDASIPLRYGLNPHQTYAELCATETKMPLKVLNGSPGYTNIMDALNGWQLVKELNQSTGLPAASSFKHVSPAGAAIGIPLNDAEAKACMVADLPLNSKNPSLAAAYARARGADRMSSFGDFIALSEKCDELTAKIISREVSDGIVAPDFEDAALNILAKKKNGNYVILKIDAQYMPSEFEERTVFGLRLKQKRNDAIVTSELFNNIVSESKLLPKSALNDLIVATIAVKYTQSNSVCFAHRGQVIGIGAGQQSRIHCTRLAGEKAANWWMRQHERVLNLDWNPSIKRAEKSNAIDIMVSGLVGREVTVQQWNQNFAHPVKPFTIEERKEWLSKLTDVAVSSDAFFPFRDNIDCAHQYGAKFIASPGGSTRDKDVIDASNEYGITLIHTQLRLFHH